MLGVLVAKSVVSTSGMNSLTLPRLESLILTHILQMEVRSEMNALKQSLQREPALPDGTPTWWPIAAMSEDAPQRDYDPREVLNGKRPDRAHRSAMAPDASRLAAVGNAPGLVQTSQPSRPREYLSWLDKLPET